MIALVAIVLLAALWALMIRHGHGGSGAWPTASSRTGGKRGGPMPRARPRATAANDRRRSFR